ncbi:MAG: hypothetical protein P4M15_11610 [Alphaproteobacteria bacterium]|nr:hypothetical protein [Alphaproteobacteria bacterium]
MPYLSAFLAAPVLTNIMLMCFVAAAACMALNYHRRIRELQKQNAEIIDSLRQIAANTKKA